ncbi:MAG: DUF2804 domain-containing protein [Myxococcota bacterium]
MTLPDAPREISARGPLPFGRYRTPIETPAIGRGWNALRRKEWHYVSVSNHRVFLAFGVVQLRYVANAFLYLVDKRQPSVAHEYAMLSPLGRALEFAPSSVHGRTRWRHRDAEIDIGWRARGGWDVRLDVPLTRGPLQGSFRIEAADALALLFDLGGGRPAYTHKAAGLRATGSVRFGDEAIDLAESCAVSDWTRSLAARTTRWKWASFAGESGGALLGLNLSAEVYDKDGASQENALWIDGQVETLGGVRFEVPRTPGVDDWRIRSVDDDAVDLTFRPLGARAQHLDLKVLRSDFVQPYGRFHGRVRERTIDGIFGVVEDHLSVW